MKLDWQKLKKPILALSPMAGFTDSPFRQIVKGINPEVLLYTEFVSSDAIKYNSDKSKKLMDFAESEKPLIVQLFGGTPENFAVSAKYVKKIGASAIDINMGCPARKVVNSGYGVCLIKDEKNAADIIKAIKNEVDLPVSVKTRLGWQDSSTLISFAQALEEAGCDAITIHGRTYKQKFEGESDWQPIYELKKHLSIPVLGNGDIHSYQEFTEKIKNLDGAMIARAAMGNPWVFSPEGQPEKFEDKIPTILKHCELAEKVKGSHGMIQMRKHLAMYIKGIPGASELRSKLVHVSTVSEVEDLLRKAHLCYI